MTAWMIWAVVTTGLFGAAAHMLERVLRAGRRQARWLWVAAIIGGLGLQAWSLLAGGQARPAAGQVGAGTALESAASAWQASIGDLLAATALERLDPYVSVLWIAASAVLLIGLLGGLWRLHRRASRWPRHCVGACEVLVSEHFGPALVGVLSPRVVVPRDLLARPSDTLTLVCLHEMEHRAARDAWVLAAGALLAAAMPWNAALWWQLARLRAAVELDCDQRVLDTGVPATQYARVLLGVGTELERHGLPIPALLQSPPLLERRLTMMITGVRRRGRFVTLATLAGAALVVAAACRTPAPTSASASPAVDVRLASLGVGEPLILVDGVEVDRSALGTLDSRSIESIEIIKGAAAARLYGDRGAGGVIRIQMKQE